MKPTSSTTPPAAQSFRQWLHGDSLDAALRRAEDDIRDHPTKTAARWLLFELLCIQGSWERALKQLQTWATLSAGSEGVAHTMRSLIRAERQRHAVFTGAQAPVPVAELTPWMDGLAQAIGLNARGDHVQADAVRARALDCAASGSGQGNLGSFTWIADSDTRLGPVCELVAQGRYRWLGFHALRSIQACAPQRLLDLVWISALLVLHDGTMLRAMLPARYPLPAAPASATDGQLLSRETCWTEVGETGIFAAGQKIWSTDRSDWPLLDIRDCTFDAAGLEEAL
jgi:type VI secretion system protein ImpE